jgi:predicted outer membrane protein
MIDDHALFNNEMRTLARQRNLVLPATPTAEQLMLLTQLQGLSGTAFDQVYMDFNARLHDQDVAQFHLQATYAVDPEIRLLAAVFYPVLKVHLTRAEEINGVVSPPAYLISAYQDSLLEIQLGQMALQNATREDVKAYAQRMITDHTSLSAQIAQTAQQKGVSLPVNLTASRQADLKDLSRFSGIKFDQAYMDTSVTAHAKELAVAQRQSAQGTDPEMKALAQASLPLLAQQYQLAVDLDNTIRASLP